MSRVNPPPHVETPKEFLANKGTRSYFQQIEFMLFQLWKRTGGGDDLIEGGVDDDIDNLANISALRSKLFKLEERVNCLEDSSNDSIMNQKIAALNQKVDELIDELIAELKLQRPDKELQKSVIENQKSMIERISLLAAILEEGFGTGITLNDISED
jgi:hypothetical protein